MTGIAASDLKEMQTQCMKEISRRKFSGHQNIASDDKVPGSPNGSLKSNKIMTNVSNFIKSPKLQQSKPPNIADLVGVLDKRKQSNTGLFPTRDRLNSAFKLHKDSESGQNNKSPILKHQGEPSFGANSHKQGSKEELDAENKNDDIFKNMMSPQIKMKEPEQEQKSTGQKNEDSQSGKKTFQNNL